ncbi:MAG: hypothetical protein CM1200mP11_2560 [Nitrosopumilaceae archaeon]|nr:MAG: hypothetical protein CM1200mP11_2560 [Nitrosopumilaceae archaeon]
MSYNREDRQMFDAKCGDCGTDCQVPFQPKEDRPVYCRECFQNHRPAPRNRDRFGGGRFGRRDDRPRQMHEQNAVIVEPIVKYHFNQKKADLYIAENVSKITDNKTNCFGKNTQNFVTFIKFSK